MNDFKIMTSDAAQSLPGVMLWHASKLWQQHLNIALADLGLSSTNAKVLSNVLHFSEEDIRATQATLAAISNVDLMTTSQALRTLEKKGFINRQVNPADKRAYAVTLTTSGRQVAFEALRRIGIAHQKFFEVFDDPNEADQLTQGLRKLIENNSIAAIKK